MFRNILAVYVVVVSLSTSASAGVMSADHATFGIASLTRDTVQGLDFLDLTLSVNRSFNNVSSQFGTGGDFEGFRYATEVEVINLINNYGFTPGAVVGQNITGWALSGGLGGLTNLLGVTNLDGLPELKQTIGITGTSVHISSHKYVELVFYSGLISTVYNEPALYRPDGYFSPNYGSFLVQSSSVVPEPGSITTFAGLLGIGLIVRRRRQRLSDR
ncbi:hypothetical protein [Aureliella helgolandensis]|uniref:PEP-CTERM protein-sorting domain-containing protein n=1 Tax=Aureliella helgolandensis TaxID=2527968 RepID=A0A518G1R9_9BACT|nr:hypothetical protein [Aureliella helgolandensis]QDV22543.1 hypothetical protein Q31a_08290 [Aureliella helgolandensis]